jgi:enamine deaminase RidA (YjgF/YER057c/UK114 family)
MIRRSNPDAVARPSGHYSHVVEVPAGSRIFYLSGQVPVRPDGQIPDSIEEQLEQCWTNILGILKELGLSGANLVKTTSFLTGTEYRDAYRDVTKRMLGEDMPASTLLIISALARPQFKVEIEAIAAG